jgi:fibronectin-binding autotransporter adhesin
MKYCLGMVMKVNSVFCARKKSYKAALLFSTALLISMRSAEASTTYSGTLAADSPSFAAFPSLFYNVYTFKGDGTSRSFTIDEAISDNANVYVYLYSGNFDPLNKESNKTVAYDGESVSGTSQYYVVIAADVNKSYSISLSPAVPSPVVPNVSFSANPQTYTHVNSRGNISTITSNAAVIMAIADNASYVPVIGSTVGNFTKSGVATFTLLGQNQYTGSTTVSAGTLSLAKNSIPSGSTITLSGGKLGAAASFSLSNPIALTQAGTIDAQGQDLILSGNISESSGSYGLTITSTGGSGVGSVSLTNPSNSYTGATTVTSGTLKLSSKPNDEQIIFNGGSFKAGGSFSMSNPVLVNSTTLDTNGSNVTLSGPVTGTNMTKIGSGTLTLSGNANEQNGTITISAGTLAIQYARSLGDTSVDVALSGGILQSVGTISPAAGNSISLLSATNVIDTYGNTFTLVGSINSSGKQLEIKDTSVEGGGIFDISGGEVPSTGTTKITSGSYKISAGSQLGSGGAAILNGGTLKISTDITASMPTLSLAANSTIDTSGYRLVLSTLTCTSDSYVLNVIGGGILDLRSAVTDGFTGKIKITSGTLWADEADAGGTTQLNGGTLQLTEVAESLTAINVLDDSILDTNGYDVTLDQAITSSAGKTLTIAGSGHTTTLAHTNDFNGPIHLTGTGSELDVTNAAEQLQGVTALQLDAGTTLKITNGGTVPCGFRF